MLAGLFASQGIRMKKTRLLGGLAEQLVAQVNGVTVNIRSKNA